MIYEYDDVARCPWCNLTRYLSIEDDLASGERVVICHHCGAQGPPSGYVEGEAGADDEAVALWSHDKAPSPRLSDETVSLEELADRERAQIRRVALAVAGYAADAADAATPMIDLLEQIERVLLAEFCEAGKRLEDQRRFQAERAAKAARRAEVLGEVQS